MIFRKALILILSISISPVFPQENETNLFKSKKKNEKFDAGVPVFSPLLLLSYTPEMEYYLTGGGLLSFKTKRNNDHLSHTYLPVLVGINNKSDFYLTSSFRSYWFDNRLMFSFQGYYQNRTDHFWGIGITNGNTVNKSDSTTRFDNEYHSFIPELSFKLFNQLFFGLKADFKKTTATQLSDLMLEDQSVLKYGTDINNTGLGIFFNYDSRNFYINPTKGIFVNIEEMFYSKSFSGDYNYEILNIDYRQYLPLFRKGSIIALQLNSKTGFGDIPWTDLQKLGTPNDLRGYFWGQYRDQSSLVIQLEYRHTFIFNDSEKLSRHGFVFWLGGGTVFPDYSKLDEILFSTGAGYRFEIQPESNIRIDVGFGTENVGIYIAYHEAF